MIQPTHDVLQYIERLYAGRDLNRTDYTNDTRPVSGGDVIDDDVARFFRLLILIKRPLKILEIGTSVGYSTVTMAQLVQHYGGQITTIELNQHTADKALASFKKFGLDNCIDLIVGDAKAVIPALEERYDLIFMDVGDKSLYYKLANDCIEKLVSGGILVAEDPLYGAYIDKSGLRQTFDRSYSELVKTLNEFNVLIAGHPDLESTLLPIGDGVTLAVKK